MQRVGRRVSSNYLPSQLSSRVIFLFNIPICGGIFLFGLEMGHVVCPSFDTVAEFRVASSASFGKGKKSRLLECLLLLLVRANGGTRLFWLYHGK
jgi:hypothetical protein